MPSAAGRWPESIPVLYLGEDESLKITHTASSRMIFVNGAWKALDFMAKRPNGYYTMKDLTGEEQ